jgi:Putative zinc-finger
MTGNHNNPDWYTTPPTPECQTNPRRISDYLSHTLTASETVNLEQHLASCSYCTSLLNSYSTLDRQIKTLSNPPASPRVRAAVMHAIAEAEADKRSLKPVRAGVVNRAPRLASSMAALAMLAAFAGVLGLMFSGRGLLPATPALASPTAGVPASITPALGIAAAEGTKVFSPEASGTPLPRALLVQPVQASVNESATNLVFTAVDNTGVTETIASRPNVVKDAPVALSPDQQRAVYSVQDGNKVNLEVYDLIQRKPIGSYNVADPLPSGGQFYAAPYGALSGDGQKLAYEAIVGNAWNGGVIDLASGKQITPPAAPRSGIPLGIGVTPTRFVGWGADGLLYTWQASEGNTISIAASSADGKTGKSVIGDGYFSTDVPWMDRQGQHIFIALSKQNAVAPSLSAQTIIDYDVSKASYNPLVASSNGRHSSGPYAETSDGKALLYIQTDAKGGQEIHTVNLSSLADKKLTAIPSGGSVVSAMQVCGATLYYQTASSDVSGKQQTTLYAQPLDGGAAKLLPARGQLIGCTAGK